MFHYVGTARSIEEMKSLKALHDIRLIAISGFARWEPMTKIQFVRAKSLKQQWFHVDGGDYRILESLKQEMGMER
ncbi:MAG: hypothetical protein K0Q59_4445 [Paenibacillus sp.]|nr:hypothetical protein [Paenibacillus sp.]